MRLHRFALTALVLVVLVALGPATAFAQAPGQTQPLASPPPYPGAASASALRTGLTFDTAIGLGILHIPEVDGDAQTTTSLGFAGTMGIGAFVSPKFALGVRLTTMTTSAEGETVITGFLGPALQFWASDNVWVRAGAGLGWAIAPSGSPDSASGFGLDVGIGYSFATHTKNAVNVSLELVPVFLPDVTFTNTSLLVGYQFL